MKIPEADIARFEELVLAAEKILIMPHKSPDGDALGASIALFHALTRAGKDVVLACVDSVPDTFHFLPGSERFISKINPADYDLVITVDAGDLKQLGWDTVHPELFDGSRPVIKVDHHPFARAFGDLQLVFTEAPASCFIMTQLFDQLGVKIRPDMATCLLNGIYTDTGSLKHSNTTPDVMRMCARLLRAGANLPHISKKVFRTNPLPQLRLWGRVLSSINRTKSGATMAVCKEEDFTETGASAEDLNGVVDYLNSVPDSLFSMLLSERNGLIKGSLRTLRDDVNVAKIATSFGGGGHVKAAGFAVPGKLEKETRWNVVEGV